MEFLAYLVVGAVVVFIGYKVYASRSNGGTGTGGGGINKSTGKQNLK